MADKVNTYVRIATALVILVIMTVIAVIVGVIWTASTGRSGQRVYLWSAFISMGIVLLLFSIVLSGFIFNDYDGNGDYFFYLYDILRWLIIPICIVLAIGFFITGMINAITGHSTDSLPYLISAVVSFAVLIILGWWAAFYDVDNK